MTTVSTHIKSAAARNILMLLLVFFINACAPFKNTIERNRGDRAPTVSVDPDTIRDATPRNDAITRAGNKNPYTVLGKTYYLLPTSKGYVKEGIASWYGKKFQGRLTANGEKYNLYAMTAAHRTLPIPAYVKVTNLDNNRTVVVRVNDRGPFHSKRIIDLSYAAAVKLGYDKKGVARVRVEAIDTNQLATSQKPAKSERSAARGDYNRKKKNINTSTGNYSNNGRASKPTDRFFLQIAAFKSLSAANSLRAELLLSTNSKVSIKTTDAESVYRVQIGPLKEFAEAEQISNRLVALGKGRPKLLVR